MYIFHLSSESAHNLHIYPRHICSLQVSRQVPHFTPPALLFSPRLNPSAHLLPFPPLHHASVLSPLRLRSFTTPRYFLPSASAGEPLSSQVNRRNPCDHLCYSEFLQITRYACGSLADANVPQNAFSPRCVFHMPSQVNRRNPCNPLCSSVFLQNVRYTCGSSSAVNVPQNALSPWCTLHPPPQVNRTISHN